MLNIFPAILFLFFLNPICIPPRLLDIEVVESKRSFSPHFSPPFFIFLFSSGAVDSHRSSQVAESRPKCFPERAAPWAFGAGRCARQQRGGRGGVSSKGNRSRFTKDGMHSTHCLFVHLSVFLCLTPCASV